MSGTLQTAPSTTLSDNNQWEYELNLTELAKRGYEGVSLTEWAAGNTTRPEVAAGSVIEIDGSTFKYTTDNAISDEAGLTDGWCYLKHVVSGSPKITTPTLTNTFGTWDAAKNGFYDGSGNRYSLFTMYRSGAITKIFTEKAIIENAQNGNIVFPLRSSIERACGYTDTDSAFNANEQIKYQTFTFQIAAGVGSGIYTPTITNLRTRIVGLFCQSQGIYNDFSSYASVIEPGFLLSHQDMLANNTIRFNLLTTHDYIVYIRGMISYI